MQRDTGRRGSWAPATAAALALLCAVALGACDPAPVEQPPERSEAAAAAPGRDVPAADRGQAGHNTLSATERAAGWRLLFDGETLDGWRGFRRDGAPDGWKAVDGTLARVGPGGDIITEDRFGNFELSLDWRIATGGNSGVFYLATEDTDWIFEGAPEMQVLDDAAHADGASPLTSAGSNFALYGAPRGVVRPAGEWNTARVLVRDGRVEHWLNGERVVEYELGSEDWRRRVADSKFAGWPSYGQAREGHIGLQDHGDPVWYRNIKIRPIE